MSDLEQMLRDALHETPTSAPRSADPVPAIQRRVRRLRLAAGVSLGAAAAVVAAVVVPMSVGTSGNARVQILNTTPTPTPTPSPTPSPSANVTGGPQPQLVWMGADWVASAPSGMPWMLYDDGSGPDGGTRIARLTPALPQDGVKVLLPAGRVVAGKTVVWVVGSNDSSTISSRVSALTTRGALIATTTSRDALLTATAVVGDDLYVLRNGNSASAEIDRMRVVGGTIQTATVAVPGAENVAATAHGDVWAQTSTKLVRIASTNTGISTSTSVEWTGDIIGTDTSSGGQDGFWTWDGSRVVQLTPSLLTTGASVAQGDRLLVPGHAAIAVTAPGGGLYLSIVEGDAPGIYYYPADQLGAGQPQPGAIWHDATAATICVDPRGGVDVTSADGIISRWDPAP